MICSFPKCLFISILHLHDFALVLPFFILSTPKRLCYSYWRLQNFFVFHTNVYKTSLLFILMTIKLLCFSYWRLQNFLVIQTNDYKTSLLFILTTTKLLCFWFAYYYHYLQSFSSIILNILWLFLIFNPLNVNPTKWSNALKQLVDFWCRIVSVSLTNLWGWRLNG